MLTRLLKWLGLHDGGVVLPDSPLFMGGVVMKPAEEVQEKPVRKYSERIIAGMGSGDSSDVNTYAMADRLGMRKGTPLPRMNDRIAIETQEALSLSVALDVSAKPIDINAVADVMDKKYIRDLETGKLALKDGLPVPDPNIGKPTPDSKPK